ncbi:unnamed protein product [Medioppia subpectinata]|uniref:Nose resistant to fluoxetine protein 6 n=1 Tax=Medioppia subpectinata TaxID=1979941 RepID=A0A7R9PZA9_9ACAR|nr:unnamed protein product [Medioppia subpectinata]CAG2106289.1 unnamed protein product [Medioppia subpectinata]
MSGTLSSLGAYDQCLETIVADDGQEVFRGQYCLLKLRPPMPPLKGRINYRRPVISLNGSKYADTWLDRRIAGQYATGFYSTYVYNGLCLPSSCTQTELNAITKRFIFSTILEMFATDCIQYEPFGIGRLVLCFSLISNIKKLFLINREKMDEKLAFVHGVRVLTMIWIICIHTFTVGTLFVPMLVYRFEDEARKFGKQLSTQFIFNGYISVGNFFFLSGLVVTYISVPVFKRTGGPTLFAFIAQRWLRFIPSMIGVICLHIMWPLMGSGPVFKGYARELTEPCSRNWWTNVLFINNWLLLPDMLTLKYVSKCHEMQCLTLFWVAYADDRTGLDGTGLILCGIAIPSAVNLKTNGPPMPMPFEEPDLDQFYRDLNTQYHPTYNHLSTYFIGVLVGYLLTRSNDLRLSWPSNTILWSVLPVCTLSATFATYLWTGLEWEYSKATAAAYSGLHRFVYILAYAWLAIYCSANSKSLISRFLGSNFFIPLSRLSFSVYLTHILVVWYFVLETRELIRFTYTDFIYSTGGVILYSMCLSLILYLLFESCWSNVLSLALKKKRMDKTDDKRKDVTEETKTNGGGKQSQIFSHKLNGKSIETEYNISRHMDTNNNSNHNKKKSHWKADSGAGNALPEYRVRSMAGAGSVYIDVGHVGHDSQPINAHINQSFNAYQTAGNTKL